MPISLLVSFSFLGFTASRLACACFHSTSVLLKQSLTLYSFAKSEPISLDLSLFHALFPPRLSLLRLDPSSVSCAFWFLHLVVFRSASRGRADKAYSTHGRPLTFSSKLPALETVLRPRQSRSTPRYLARSWRHLFAGRHDVYKTMRCFSEVTCVVSNFVPTCCPRSRSSVSFSESLSISSSMTLGTRKELGRSPSFMTAMAFKSRTRLAASDCPCS